MKTIILLAFLSISTISHAAEYEVLFHAAHYDTSCGSWSSEFNDNVFGIGLVDHNFGLGIYKNSFSKTTIYAVRIFPITSSFGIEAGAATGYEQMYGLPIQPLAVGYFKIGHHLKIRVIPGPVTAFGVSYVF